MPLAGQEPSARAHAHYRWAQRYASEGRIDQAIPHFGRALHYGTAPAVNPKYLWKDLDTEDPDYEEKKFKKLNELKKLKPIHIGEFVVNIAQDSEGGKVYECPACGFKSGSAAVAYPSDMTLFAHSPSCPNNGKIPIEPGRY